MDKFDSFHLKLSFPFGFAGQLRDISVPLHYSLVCKEDSMLVCKQEEVWDD